MSDYLLFANGIGMVFIVMGLIQQNSKLSKIKITNRKKSDTNIDLSYQAKYTGKVSIVIGILIMIFGTLLVLMKNPQ